MFDRVEITIRAGSGGDGAISLHREKFMPFGGPDGGDGGDGGDVILLADPSVSGLGTFRQGGLYRAGNGGSGQGNKKHGKKGENLVLKVPVGTIARDKKQTGEDVLVADCKLAGQQAVVARGGRGGMGNTRFVSSTNQVPRLAQKGGGGEEVSLVMELRLIADVGIIGFPNVGKSTLLAAVSAAKPKIASFPFTTLEPVLGMVEVGQQRFVLAEIPGLIEGAHLGRGLGHDFLRHALRTRVLIHLVDGTSDDFSLAQKPQVVVVNKVDLPPVQARLAELKKAFSDAGISVFFVSAASGDGITELMAAVLKLLNKITAEAKVTEKVPQAVFRPQPKRAVAIVVKQGNTFLILVPELERIVDRVDMANPEVLGQFRAQLNKLRITQALEKAGIKPGDKVRCGNFEWEW
ncbi:MAG: GTPase ObgE [Chloroflexi bacterium]|nr:GTPase ObgE [Chloroflexota bacterium]